MKRDEALRAIGLPLDADEAAIKDRLTTMEQRIEQAKARGGSAEDQGNIAEWTAALDRARAILLTSVGNAETGPLDMDTVKAPTPPPAWLDLGDGRSVLLDGPKLRIGRELGDVEIPLLDKSVSRLHAIIYREGRTWYLEDQGSLNGTRVNREVALKGERVELADGARLRFGNIETTFYQRPPLSAVPGGSENTVMVASLQSSPHVVALAHPPSQQGGGAGSPPAGSAGRGVQSRIPQSSSGVAPAPAPVPAPPAPASVAPADPDPPTAAPMAPYPSRSGGAPGGASKPGARPLPGGAMAAPPPPPPPPPAPPARPGQAGGVAPGGSRPPAAAPKRAPAPPVPAQKGNGKSKNMLALAITVIVIAAAAAFIYARRPKPKFEDVTTAGGSSALAPAELLSSAPAPSGLPGTASTPAPSDAPAAAKRGKPAGETLPSTLKVGDAAPSTPAAAQKPGEGSVALGTRADAAHIVHEFDEALTTMEGIIPPETLDATTLAADLLLLDNAAQAWRERNNKTEAAVPLLSDLRAFLTTEPQPPAHAIFVAGPGRIGSVLILPDGRRVMRSADPNSKSPLTTVAGAYLARPDWLATARDQHGALLRRVEQLPVDGATETGGQVVAAATEALARLNRDINEYAKKAMALGLDRRQALESASKRAAAALESSLAAASSAAAAASANPSEGPDSAGAGAAAPVAEADHLSQREGFAALISGAVAEATTARDQLRRDSITDFPGQNPTERWERPALPALEEPASAVETIRRAGYDLSSASLADYLAEFYAPRTFRVPARNSVALQRAIESARPGDIVYLEAGVHSPPKPVVISSAITLRGDDKSPTILDLSPVGAPVPMLVFSQAHGAVVQMLTVKVESADAISVRDSRVWLDELLLQTGRGSASGGGGGEAATGALASRERFAIHVQGNPNSMVAITHSQLAGGAGVELGLLKLTATRGFLQDVSTDVPEVSAESIQSLVTVVGGGRLVARRVRARAALIWLEVAEDSRAMVVESKFRMQGGQTALHASDSARLTASFNEFRAVDPGPSGSAPSQPMVLVSGASSALLTRNNFVSPTGNGIVVRDSRSEARLQGNTVLHAGGNGIAFLSGAQGTAESNTVIDCESDGILASGIGTRLSLTGNTVAGNAGGGILFRASAGGDVQKNIVRGNGREGISNRPGKEGEEPGSAVIASTNVVDGSSYIPDTSAAVPAATAVSAEKVAAPDGSGPAAPDAAAGDGATPTPAARAKSAYQPPADSDNLPSANPQDQKDVDAALKNFRAN